MKPLKNLNIATNEELRNEADYLTTLFNKTRESIVEKMEILAKASDRYSDIALILENRGDPLIDEEGNPVSVKVDDSQDEEDKGNAIRQYSKETPYNAEDIQ